MMKKIRTIRFVLKKSKMETTFTRNNREYLLIRDIILLFVALVHLLFKEILIIRILILQSISIRIAFRKNFKSLITFLTISSVSHLECLLQVLNNQICPENQLAFSVCRIEIHLEVNSSLGKLKKSHKINKTGISFLKNKRTMISRISER